MFVNYTCNESRSSYGDFLVKLVEMPFNLLAHLNIRFSLILRGKLDSQVDTYFFYLLYGRKIKR